MQKQKLGCAIECCEGVAGWSRRFILSNAKDRVPIPIMAWWCRLLGNPQHKPRSRHRPHFADQSALAPWIDQVVDAFPTPTDCLTCVPFMNQIATLPPVSCHRMSLLPSPSKSPVSTIDQLAGAEPTAADCVT